MTNEEQRIAIAGACGWEEIRTHHAYLNLIGRHPEFGPNKDVPDFPNDLNGMHEAEKRIDKNAFVYHLCSVLGYSCASAEALEACIFATSAQRAEAFLRTLNLWKN